MSVYYVQKLMYQLNRDPSLRIQFDENPNEILSMYTLSDEEKKALLEPDIGLLYVMGVNGQILMHYAAIFNMPWPDYLRAMEVGLQKYGPVRSGLYVMSEMNND